MHTMTEAVSVCLFVSRTLIHTPAVSTMTQKLLHKTSDVKSMAVTHFRGQACPKTREVIRKPMFSVDLCVLTVRA
jgi:hypothetical protein